MPQITTELSPSRLRLRVLHTLMSQPGTFTVRSLAAHLGEPYQRVYDAVQDVAAEFGTTTTKKRISVILPGQTVVL